MSVITIVVRDNGPYRISAEDATQVRVVDAAGRELVTVAGKHISLCRCGQSATKPVCDGTHKTCGFDGGWQQPEPSATPSAP
ncbi:MAG: CDGSH iron-sulfur domain-containing protein [Gemmatimonadaceae bacterium]